MYKPRARIASWNFDIKVAVASGMYSWLVVQHRIRRELGVAVGWVSSSERKAASVGGPRTSMLCCCSL